MTHTHSHSYTHTHTHTHTLIHTLTHTHTHTHTHTLTTATVVCHLLKCHANIYTTLARFTNKLSTDQHLVVQAVLTIETTTSRSPGDWNPLLLQMEAE